LEGNKVRVFSWKHPIVEGILVHLPPFL